MRESASKHFNTGNSDLNRKVCEDLSLGHRKSHFQCSLLDGEASGRSRAQDVGVFTHGMSTLRSMQREALRPSTQGRTQLEQTHSRLESQTSEFWASSSDVCEKRVSYSLRNVL